MQVAVPKLKMKSTFIFLFILNLGLVAVKKSAADRWQKQNIEPVCFGAKFEKFGKFHIQTADKRLAAVKLVHLYGYVTCDRRFVSYWSYWGCGSYRYGLDRINVVITTAANDILLPPSQFLIPKRAKWSKVPGYNSLSPELVLSSFSPDLVSHNQELRVWYGEDLTNTLEEDNGGTTCVDVYAIFV